MQDNMYFNFLTRHCIEWNSSSQFVVNRKHTENHAQSNNFRVSLSNKYIVVY